MANVEELAGPRARNAEAKRRAILEGAKRVFLRHGFEGSSMDGVAQASGVSKMTVYRYFDGKEELFAGLIEDLCRRMFEEDPLAGMEGLPPDEALRRFARGFAATVFDPETITLHRIVVAEAARFPELGRLFYERGPDRNVAALAAYFAANADHPTLEFDDPLGSASDFLSLVRGYDHLRLLLGVEGVPDATELAQRIDRAIGHFVRIDRHP